MVCLVITLFVGLSFYFICITDIITKQYNNSEIHVQTLYKWDSEGSQMTYLNLYLYYLLLFNIPVNNFSVMLERNYRFLGITSTFRG